MILVARGLNRKTGQRGLTGEGGPQMNINEQIAWLESLIGPTMQIQTAERILAVVASLGKLKDLEERIGDVFIHCPVGRECTTHVFFKGAVTQKALLKLIALLKMSMEDVDCDGEPRNEDGT